MCSVIRGDKINYIEINKRISNLRLRTSTFGICRRTEICKTNYKVSSLFSKLL